MGSNISWVDRTIAAALVIVLLALLGVGLAQQSSPSRPVTPAASGSPDSVAQRSGASPPPTSAPVPASTTPTPPSNPTPAAASAASGSSGTTAPPPVPGPVSAVGDSIMLDIQPYLEADIPGADIDGMVSRQFETGISVVQADRAAGTLGNVLVVELGTNGTVTASDFDAMMQAAAGVQRVVFVNVDVPRSWEAEDNAVLAAGVARYPGLAVLADWYTLSSGHPEWFTPDQVHLEPAGAQALAALIAQYT
jgi:hypothetical protein